MKRTLIVVFLALLPHLPLRAELPPLIPRQLLWGNPERTSPQLAPDGKQLAWLAADAKGVQNVWAKPIDGGEARLVTNETHRPIYSYKWAADGLHILYLQDSDGDENNHLYSAELSSGNVRDLTPWRGIRAQNILTSLTHPNEVLLGMNLRDRSVFDLYRVDLTSGATTLEVQNPGDVLTWSADNDFIIRGATVFDPTTAQSIIRVRDGAGQPWRDLVVMPFERALFSAQVFEGSLIAGFAPDNQSIIVHTALHSDTGRLERIDLKSGKTLEVVAEDPKSDVAEDYGNDHPTVITDLKSGAIQAVKFDYLVPEWRFIDATLKSDFEAIGKVAPGFIRLISRDRDDHTWIVSTSSPSAPVSYYTYDRRTRKVAFLFSDNAALAKYKLADKKAVLVRARDGLELVCYLALPPGLPPRHLPLVASIHGGPNFRDTMDFDPDIQLLTNRGYAVLQVNFRGSTGFGLRYLNLGNKEWGLGQSEDIYDAVNWAIKQGIADPKRIASYGWSGGGFATLRALEMRPDLFACGIDAIGPSDIATLLRTVPSYWNGALPRWRLRVGDADHDEVWNRKISPLYHVDQIRSPLLIFAGANDPRVKLESIETMVKTLRAAKRDVSFVVYTDEGHGFARPENNLDCTARIEEFLARHLGGRAEPFTKMEGTTADVR